MKFKPYDLNYRENLDTLCKMRGFINADVFGLAKVFIPKSLEIIGPPDTNKKQVNCHGYTFEKDCWYKVKNVHDLIVNKKLINAEEPEAGNIIIYYLRASKSLPIIKHTGIYLGNGKVRSKWACGPILKHDVFNVPYSYGEIIKFFRRIGDQ